MPKCTWTLPIKNFFPNKCTLLQICLGIYAAAIELLHKEDYRHHLIVGYSGVIFGWMALLSARKSFKRPVISQHSSVYKHDSLLSLETFRMLPSSCTCNGQSNVEQVAQHDCASFPHSTFLPSSLALDGVYQLVRGAVPSNPERVSREIAQAIAEGVLAPSGSLFRGQLGSDCYTEQRVVAVHHWTLNHQTPHQTSPTISANR